ncbi:MAG: dolichyl-phosphate beta-glucosyltransferase [Bdellovibrionota bacterium]
MSLDTDSAKKPALSLVIPAYNEERRLPTSLGDIKAFFTKIPLPLEVLVMIEKSTDRTLELAKSTVSGDSRFVINDNEVQRGKGYAVKLGMVRAQGDYVFFMDADLSTPLSEIFKFVAHFESNPQTDVIIGNRADAKSQIVKQQSWFRRNLGRGFNRFVQVFGVQGIKDTQCGFKAFRNRAAREIFSRQTLNGFAFDVEVLMLAQTLGYKIDVLPVRWINSDDSKVRVLIDPLKMLWDLIRIRRIVQKTVREKPLSP